jgi:hypothetical protein
MRNPLLLTPVVVALVFAGCSVGSSNIDTDKAEKEITKGFEQQVPGKKVKTLECPDEVEAKKGVKTTCDIALASGEKGTINLRVLNDDGDIRWNVAGGGLK